MVALVLVTSSANASSFQKSEDLVARSQRLVISSLRVLIKNLVSYCTLPPINVIYMYLVPRLSNHVVSTSSAAKQGQESFIDNLHDEGKKHWVVVTCLYVF